MDCANVVDVTPAAKNLSETVLSRTRNSDHSRRIGWSLVEDRPLSIPTWRSFDGEMGDCVRYIGCMWVVL